MLNVTVNIFTNILVKLTGNKAENCGCLSCNERIKIESKANNLASKVLS